MPSNVCFKFFFLSSCKFQTNKNHRTQTHKELRGTEGSEAITFVAVSTRNGVGVGVFGISASMNGNIAGASCPLGELFTTGNGSHGFAVGVFTWAIGILADILCSSFVVSVAVVAGVAVGAAVVVVVAINNDDCDCDTIGCGAGAGTGAGAGAAGGGVANSKGFCCCCGDTIHTGCSGATRLWLTFNFDKVFAVDEAGARASLPPTRTTGFGSDNFFFAFA